MVAAISNLSTSSANAAPAATQVQSGTDEKSATSSIRGPSTFKDDTVKLSLAANIKLMLCFAKTRSSLIVDF